MLKWEEWVQSIIVGLWFHLVILYTAKTLNVNDINKKQALWECFKFNPPTPNKLQLNNIQGKAQIENALVPQTGICFSVMAQKLTHNSPCGSGQLHFSAQKPPKHFFKKKKPKSTEYFIHINFQILISRGSQGGNFEWALLEKLWGKPRVRTCLQSSEDNLEEPKLFATEMLICSQMLSSEEMFSLFPHCKLRTESSCAHCWFLGSSGI